MCLYSVGWHLVLCSLLVSELNHQNKNQHKMLCCDKQDVQETPTKNGTPAKEGARPFKGLGRDTFTALQVMLVERGLMTTRFFCYSFSSSSPTQTDNCVTNSGFHLTLNRCSVFASFLCIIERQRVVITWKPHSSKWWSEDLLCNHFCVCLFVFCFEHASTVSFPSELKELQSSIGWASFFEDIRAWSHFGKKLFWVNVCWSHWSESRRSSKMAFSIGSLSNLFAMLFLLEARQVFWIASWVFLSIGVVGTNPYPYYLLVCIRSRWKM